MSKGRFEVPGTRQGRGGALKSVFLCLRAQELRVASSSWGLLASFLGSFVKGTPPLCIGCVLLHISLSNWGFVLAPSWWVVAKVRLKNS